MPDLNLFDLIATHSNPTRYENFLSVSLAWCMENDEEFRKQFFQKILFPNDSKGDDWNGWKIEVQKSISIGTRTKYPDLLLSKPEKFIIIEVKYDADLSYSRDEDDSGADNDREKEETFERQRERFAQTFLNMVEELLTLGKSLGENGGLK